MKNKNKALLLALCAALLVGATVLTTIAWLTSTGTVTNTFTVGKVQIELWEAKTDKLGEYFLIETSDTSDISFDYSSDSSYTYLDADQVKGNEYTLRPGHTYKKEVYIELIEGSEPCYLFVKVENGFASSETDDCDMSIEAQMYYNGWLPVEGHKDVWAMHIKKDGTMSPNISTKDEYIAAFKSDNERKRFEYEQGTDYANAVSVFSTLTLSGDADVESLTGKEIKITAYAVQADGFDAKDAYDKDIMTDKEVWETAFPTEAGEIDETTTPAPTT